MIEKITYEQLKELSLDELRVYRQRCLDMVHELQNSNDIEQITYWTTQQAQCLNLIRSKQNG